MKANFLTASAQAKERCRLSTAISTWECGKLIRCPIMMASIPSRTAMNSGDHSKRAPKSVTTSLVCSTELAASKSLVWEHTQVNS